MRGGGEVGSDSIDVNILKQTYDAIKKYLIRIFDLSLQSGINPDK